MNGLRILFAAVVVLVVATAWFALRTGPQRPDVIVVLIDSLRADRLVADPAGREPMPFLSELAARSVSYDQAYAPSPWTLPSVVSLFSGLYPSEHGVSWWPRSLDASHETLAEVLQRNGYETIAFSAHGGIKEGSTVAQGFARYEIVGNPTAVDAPDATEVNAAVLKWLRGRGDDARPFFLFLHYMDVHLPYRRHAGFTRPSARSARADELLSERVASGPFSEDAKRARLWDFGPNEIVRLNELYDGEARYLDAQIGKLLGGLERQGRLDHAVVVVTADHGEEFGEHGVFGHATTLYEPVVRVPLSISLPGGTAARVRAPVQMAGLASTLFDALDVDAPPSFRIPPLPLHDGSDPAPPWVYTELLDTNYLKLRLHEKAIVWDGAKLLVTPDGQRVVYDRDPAEQRPATDPERGRAIETVLLEVEGELVVAGRAAPEIELDQETIDRLRALGYQE